jgi:hypothetical protein
MVEHLRMRLKRGAGENKAAQKQNARDMVEPHGILKRGQARKVQAQAAASILSGSVA